MEKRTLQRKTPAEGLKRKSYDMSMLMGELLAATTKTHMMHLATQSYAVHMALGEFYEAIPTLVDGIAEQYQGATEKLLDIPAVTPDPIETVQEAVAYLRDLHKKISIYQEECMLSEIKSELDIVKSCIDKTKYKLIFLK